jgi:hypothetical protein
MLHSLCSIVENTYSFSLPSVNSNGAADANGLGVCENNSVGESLNTDMLPDLLLVGCLSELVIC